MGRSLRLFLIAYALTMITCTASLGKSSFSEPDMVWFLFGYAAVSYLALALDQTFTNDHTGGSRRTALAVMFAAALSLPVVFYFETSPSERSIRLTCMLAIAVPAYLFCTGLLLHRMKAERKRKEGRFWQVGVASALVAGAAMVMASIAMNTTEHARGWSILGLKAKWITSEVNVATGFFGPEIAWLQPFYKPGGYVFYLLALIATISMLVGLVASRMNLRRARESVLCRASLLIINIAGFWVLNDIFWGWHFDLSNNPVPATIATALWLAGPLFVVVLVIPLIWRKNDVWRLRMLLAFQFPIAAFNMAMIGEYWSSDLDLPGLGLLILGLQLESLACIELLASRDREKATVLELQAERAPQTHSMAA